MRTNNTFGIHFITRANKAKGELLPLYVRIVVDNQRVELSLKRFIKPTEWNEGKGMARGSRDDIKSLNHYLEEVRSKLMSCYQEMQLQNQLITADAIKSKFLGSDQKAHSLGSLMAYHSMYSKEKLAPGTLKNYSTTQKYLEKFVEKRSGASDIFLSELSYKFLTEFEQFLRSHKPLANNGVMKHIERFRKMVNMAIRLEWIEKDPFAKYKQRFDKVERGFLSEKELAAIEGKEISIDRISWVRDLFVFSCYTGLAYIDVMQLTPSNVAIGIDGEFWLITSRKKTNNPVRVPLLPEALAIIEKYKANPRAIRNGTLFPVITNQKLNAYLKELTDLCGITKNLTFHLARHTFATTVTLTNGVPIESVSKMLGHSKITTTQIYAKVIETKLGEDVKRLREKLEGNKSAIKEVLCTLKQT